VVKKTFIVFLLLLFLICHLQHDEDFLPISQVFVLVVVGVEEKVGMGVGGFHA
jgi:hypothetical protein